MFWKIFRILLLIMLSVTVVFLSFTIDSKNKEIENLNNEITELKIDKEDYVPKEQYLDDIEFLESVILELRGEFERECDN